MNLGFAIFGTGTVFFLALSILGTILDDISSRTWTEKFPVFFIVFGIALMLSFSAMFIGAVTGFTMLVWSFV